MKRFVDDYGVLAIEKILIETLPTLFIPQMVNNLTEDEIARLAGENQDITSRRSRCVEELNILQAGIRDLRKLDGHWHSIKGNKTSLRAPYAAP